MRMRERGIKIERMNGMRIKEDGHEGGKWEKTRGK